MEMNQSNGQSNHENTTSMMLLHHTPILHEQRITEGSINLRLLHGDDTINNQVTFLTGRDAKYFLQDYCYNQNKSMKLKIGKNSGNSKTFICTSSTLCEWKIIATKSKRKNEETCFYFSTIHNIHSITCTSTRKPSERQHMILTSVHGIIPSTFESQDNPSKKPRRENPVEKIVRILVECHVDRQKLSIKMIQDLYFEKNGYRISTHAATRAKQVYLGLEQEVAGSNSIRSLPSPTLAQENRQQFQDIQAMVEQNKMVEVGFLRAVSVGDISAVRTFLRNGKSDLIETNGNGALLLATKGQYLNIVDTLLSHGAKTEAIDDTGVTALYVAVKMGNFHIAKCLLDHGAKVDTTDENLRTPLLIASDQGDLKMVKLLLKRHANIEASDEDDNTSLIVATRNGCIEVVHFLLRKGANRMIQNLHGQNAVGLATSLHSYEMSQLFTTM